MGKSILLTGITGFLGSHICRYLLTNGYDIIGLKRSVSDTWRCKNFEKTITWVNVDQSGWENEIANYHPEMLIHTAWDGVSSVSRNNYKHQLKNLDFLIQLLEVSKTLKINKIISFGSQAEYGKLDSIAKEEQILLPDSAYAIVKVMASKLVEHFCISNHISWYWLRVFSVFGEMESDDWLIPSLVNKIVNKEPVIKFSSCEQKYAYMYIDDFVRLIQNFVDQEPLSGIYNVSANNAITIKEIVFKIHAYIDSNSSFLDFGSIPQRENQSSIIEGSMDKFNQNVANFQFSDLNSNLIKTVDYYRFRFNNSFK